MNPKSTLELILSGVGIVAITAFVLSRPSFDLTSEPQDTETPVPGSVSGTRETSQSASDENSDTQTQSASNPTPPPDDSARLSGIDVSHYQGNIDWVTVKSTGVLFAYAKATDGLTYTDPKFASNQTGATAQGLAFGAYHFYEPQDDPIAQAKHFLSVAKVGKGWLPAVLDLERSPGSNDPTSLADGAEQWLQYVEGNTGCKPMVYASPTFYNQYLGAAFSKYPLWLAEYANSAKLPTGVSAWQIWQHSQKGRVDGVSGNVDLDWFAGDASALKAFLCGDGG